MREPDRRIAIKHSRSRLVLAAVLAGNGVAIGLLTDGDAWLRYLIFALAAAVALLGFWYVLVPAVLVRGFECVVSQSPGTAKARIDLSGVKRCSYDRSARLLQFEFDDGRETVARISVDRRQLDRLAQALGDLSISFSVYPAKTT